MYLLTWLGSPRHKLPKSQQQPLPEHVPTTTPAPAVDAVKPAMHAIGLEMLASVSLYDAYSTDYPTIRTLDFDDDNKSLDLDGSIKSTTSDVDVVNGK